MGQDLRSEYREQGFLASALPVSEPGVLERVHDDLPLFRAELETITREGRSGIPQLCTDAIHAAAHDPSVLAVVASILEDEPWVMWGPNIREGTPNAAHRWHVDLESWLWPSVTVAVGLRGCSSDAATWFLPGSQRLSRAPDVANDVDSDASVVAAARALDPRCGTPQQVRGFGDARFYVFDARCWHRGGIAASLGRVVLFLHYQRARDPRIPCMLDYERHQWSREPTPYIASRDAGAVRTDVQRLPWRYRLGRVLDRLRGRA